MLVLHAMVFSFYCWRVFHCVNTPQFILLTVDGHLGCFQFLAMMSDVTMDVLTRVFAVCVLAFLVGIYPALELLGYRVCSALEDAEKLFSEVVLSIYASTRSVWWSQMLYIFVKIFSVFLFGHFGWYALAFYSFNLNFCNDWWAWAAFSCFFAFWIFFCEIRSYSYLWPIVKVATFKKNCLLGVLYILWIQ